MFYLLVCQMAFICPMNAIWQALEQDYSYAATFTTKKNYISKHTQSSYKLLLAAFQCKTGLPLMKKIPVLGFPQEVACVGSKLC